MIDLSSLRRTFQNLNGADPRLFWAPGRVNLIGEHTDYNDGFVLPIGIDLGTVVAAGPRDHRHIRADSLTLNLSAEFDLDGPPAAQKGDWYGYVEGVARTLEARGLRLVGANLAIDSNLPLGAGLSSSAALEMSAGLALLTLSRHEIEPIALALAGQSAEHTFVGTNCGIMDQCIAMLAEEGHALLIDCRSLDTTPVPLNLDDMAFVVCDSRVKHSLATSQYNVRRAECEQGVALLGEFRPGIRALRDVTEAELNEYQNRLPEPIRRRCRHVVTENARTLAAAEALRAGEIDRVGSLMVESHNSLRDDYEVSCSELDLLVEIAASVEGVVGARMTGGGFGGCTVNLVRLNALEMFRERTMREYSETTGFSPLIHVVRATGGAGEILAPSS
ncbi:MAG TPA: galactokinase [Blastocatellia bacterium]|nr:galactokinase [Blastocatellia bacterium]